jgi:isohexenylglutaconyl-CoA hydratase
MPYIKDTAMTLPASQTLLVNEDKGILHITLNRPESRNSMSLQMVQELQATFAWAANNAIRAVVLRGAGGHFCAGGDIRDMMTIRQQATDNPQAYQHFNRTFGHLLTQVNSAPFVVVTVLEGAILGGGFGLACVSDVALAKADAQFGMPETRLGIIPAQIAPFIVQRLGLTQARRLALLGMRINGESAQKIGLVHEVYADNDTLETALARVINDLKQCAPNATQVTKALLHQVGEQPLEQLLDDAADAFACAIQSSEGMEGGMAFVQKRAASWVQ